MPPQVLRKRLGFLLGAASGLTVSTAAPALAQGMGNASLVSAVPWGIVLALGAFGLLGVVLVRNMIHDGRQAQRRATGQIATLRALVDDYEALLSGADEITVMWGGRVGLPKFLGPASTLLPTGRRVEAVLDFGVWMEAADATLLDGAVKELRASGRSFDLHLRSKDGRQIEALGWPLGGGAALRLRPTGDAVAQRPAPRNQELEATLALLPDPAFLLGTGKIPAYVNAAYRSLAKGRPVSPSELAEANDLELVEVNWPAGRAGYLRAKPKAALTSASGIDNLAHLGAIIDALTTPIAIFNAGRGLVQSNRAYAALWRLDPKWLKPGLDERTILDKLRTLGMLPTESDYQAWRARHLQSYTLKGPRESEPWYLPDGRIVQVVSAPAGPNGGVIYVFEDITDQLRLKSQYQTQIDVQRSTLNALSEAVAVFGTNGKLTLSNPRLSSVWKLPMNMLEAGPHIDQIIEAAGRALPEDGASQWRDLKRRIVDLNPTRTDTNGRFLRSDGRMVDYAVTRLPDGQTLMTFVDVTESANYQRVLTERNDALVTADRLKDAFVQNVSYELRSPLTNIIGFADLLASETFGTLNDKQRAYTDYIRASSVTLGVLIDNILDLATVDAGVAELRLEPQNVPALIEKARAGLAATFPEVDGEKPLNLEVDIPETLPPLLADGTRIVQVLYNLLSTAARFSEPGGLVKLTVIERNARMLFTIEDDGAHMSEQMRAELNAGSGATAGRQRGAGLGLAIVRSFVSMHGGTISVERSEPRGSRVVVSIPVAAALSTAAE